MNRDSSMRKVKRSKDVLTILVRNGFGGLVETLRHKRGKASIGGEDSGEETRSLRLTRAERMRKVIEELGPTYVKLGQVLSTRSDLVPPDLLAELAKLQDQVGSFPFDEVRRIVEVELGQPLEVVFESFECNPLASASLGQVHRARLNGQDVAVKVQRPGIRETVDADIKVMMRLANQLERYVDGWAIYQPVRVVKEFAQSIEEELDYQIEATHQERFAERFQDDSTVHVPRVFRRATTSRVLTMEFIDGIKVSDLKALRAANMDLEKVARRGFHFVIQQTLVDGFFHADPHPGNIFVLSNNVVCFIDFGMMGRLSQKVRDDFVELVYHVIDQKPTQVTEALLRLTTSEVGITAPELERDVAQLLDAYAGRPLCKIDLSVLLGRISVFLDQHGLRIPPDLYLMLKAIIQIQATAVALAPEFDLAKEAEPHVRRVFLDRYRPRRLAEETAAVSREFVSMLRDAPATMSQLSRVVEGGGIRVKVEQDSMARMLSANDRIANRIAFAFVLGASLVGSAIIAAAKIPPTWNGISLLGLGGFLVTLTMSARLLISILSRDQL